MASLIKGLSRIIDIYFLKGLIKLSLFLLQQVLSFLKNNSLIRKNFKNKFYSYLKQLIKG
ncbi:hypothetical protein HMPREF3189_01590 [Clostridiales bacterium KA00134]|nr:hypothetical protein HMPREF3189_01590 [Clostridiales bacterium KA00134]